MAPKRKENPDDTRYTEFQHPNARGHKLIAEGIYNFLAENKLVPKKHIKDTALTATEDLKR